MAQILWEKFDTFIKGSTRGIVLSDGRALIIFGEGGRGGYDISMEEVIPDGVTPVDMAKLPFEVQLAFRAVMVQAGEEDPG